MNETSQQLSCETGESWPAIEAARAKTEQLLATLRDGLGELDDASFSIIVTGSLGRAEASERSDVDWYLLVDGPSDPEHGPLRQKISKRIDDLGFRQPGQSGTFGALVTSHELVHYIAGTRDSNENLTRRILLLSESRALTGSLVRERVIGNVLARYVIHDPPVRPSGTRTIPLFLLNDVVRYWRTVASDYPSKMWDRQHEGWAIRNIKLRFSRKLLFAWGLITSFAGELFAGGVFEGVDDTHERLTRLSEIIRQQTNVTPLELVALMVLETGDDALARQIFSSYDVFLRAMSDTGQRKHLEDLPFGSAATDAMYHDLQSESRRFGEGITALFFDAHPKLPKLIRKFGVF
jgi:hypothetical protein